MTSRGPDRLLLLAVFALLVPPAVRAQEAGDPVQSITEAELRDHIHYLASDFLEGRETGEAGYLLAAQYGAVHFHAAGLVPLFSDSSGAPSFFQQIGFEKTLVSSASVIRLTMGGVEKTYRFGEEFLVQGRAGMIGGTPVFLGYGIEEPELGWNDYDGLDLAGKVAVIVCGAPMRHGEPVLPEEQHQLYASLGPGLNARFRSAFEHRASAVVLVLDTMMAKEWSKIAQSISRPAVAPVAVDPEGSSESPLSWIVFLRSEAAAGFLAATGFDAVASMGEYTPGPIEGVRVAIELKRDVEDAYYSPNVAGLLAGTDPPLKDEYIVVTAHLDHVGVENGVVFNGADDNASGSAAVLEVAEAAAMAPAKRSIIFVLFTAEEAGLHGSRYFTDNPPVPIERVVLNINLDMVGRNSPPYPASLLALASEDKRPQLVELITSVNESRVHANLDLRLNEGEDPHQHMMRSDQRPFTQKGIPAILLTRGFMGPDYHEASDDPETINYDKVLQAARLAWALAAEAANREVLFDRE